MEKTNRVEWIDAARGIGILAVIGFHTEFLPNIRISDPLIGPWMLSLFLFSGGWLLKNRPFTPDRFRSTARRLLVPFFLSGIVSFLGWLILRTIYPGHILYQPIGTELVKWLTGRNPYFNSPLWFIPTYLIASCCMQWVSPWWFRLRVWSRAVISVLVVGIGFFLSHPYTYPLFSYDLVIVFIGMLMMGSVASAVRIPDRVPRWVLILPATIAFAVISISNGYVDMFQREFGSEFSYLLTAVLGTYVVKELVAYGVRNHRSCAAVCTKLGQSSMSLMVWHWPVMQWLTYALSASGVIGTIASGYTKKSFVFISQSGGMWILQCLLLLLYVSVSVAVILGTERLLRKIINRLKTVNRIPYYK